MPLHHSFLAVNRTAVKRAWFYPSPEGRETIGCDCQPQRFPKLVFPAADL
ncbi:Uncharacterised protein [Vibrio cholerae]|nr:Uncharacterised protein [Vibrio cholerae]